LLDILAARKDPHGLTGDVFINGAPQPANFKCISGYVVQDDVVMGTLTVRENFQFSAALRLPKTVKTHEKEERINQIIKELGLTKVADSKVGTQFIRGISGGERKRTNIGMELITDPAILFLDEPTTGLDASTANAVLLLLKRMCKQGKTIIFSIHQPRYSIFRLFDKLTLLAAGRLLYHGPAQNALEYFKTIGYECEPYNNPADFFLDIINGDSTAVASHNETDKDQTLADKLVEKYCGSSYNQEAKTELEKLSSKGETKEKTFQKITYSTSFFHQMKWVSKRMFKNLIVIGYDFPGISRGCHILWCNKRWQRIGAMFFMTTNQCFSSISAIELFVVEKKIFIHEYISGYYRISAYFFSKLMADLIPMRTLPSIIFTCIVYFMLGLKPTVEAFFIMMFTLMMVSYTATSMALAIATGHNVVAVANLLMTISFVFMIIFSGLLVNLTSILSWLSWLQYFSIPRYGMTALQINELVGLDFCNFHTNENWSTSNCTEVSTIQPCSGVQYLESQGIDATNWGLWQNHVALASMTIIFLTISYLKLHFMKNMLDISKRKVTFSSKTNLEEGSIVTFYNVSYFVKFRTGYLGFRKEIKKNILFNDDIVMGTLTVRENLMFSAALRLPLSTSKYEKNQRVDQVLKELDLAKVADTKVGTYFSRGVSGGERKRTSIGLELITNPKVLMSLQGKTIIFSIHQPRYSIFKLFDSLTLLAAGRLLYHGPADNALPYFKSLGFVCEPYNNPADFFLDIINGDSSAVATSKMAIHSAVQFSKCNFYKKMLEELDVMSKEQKRLGTMIKGLPYSTPFLHQLKWLSRRTFKNLIGNPQNSTAQIAIITVMGIITGAVFSGVKNDATGIQNRVGALFFLATNQVLNSITTVELFIAEKRIFM
ncbi:ATP-binding cassette sub-family G member 2, partial [Ophiophagus hannah]